MQATTQQTKTTQVVNTDPKAFSEQYLDKKTGVMVFAIILLIIGILMFFQVCSVQMGVSDASGIAGSSQQSSGYGNGEYNPQCAGFAEFIAVLIIGASLYWLATIMTTKSNAEKLVKSGHLLAACTIDSKKGVTATNELLQAQITLNETEAQRRGMEMHHIDVETDDDDDEE